MRSVIIGSVYTANSFGKDATLTIDNAKIDMAQAITIVEQYFGGKALLIKTGRNMILRHLWKLDCYFGQQLNYIGRKKRDAERVAASQNIQ